MHALPFRGMPRLTPLVARNLRYDMLASVCATLYLIIPNSFGGVIGRHLGAGPVHLGIYWSFAYAGCLLAIFSGLWMPKGKLLAYAVIAGIVGRSLLVPAAFIGEPLLFLIVVSLSWSSLDITHPITSDVSRRIYPIQQRGQLVSFVRMAAVLSALVVAPIFGWILDLFGPRLLLLLGAGIGVVGWLVYSQIRVPPGEAETQPRFTPRDLWDTARGDPRLLRWIVTQIIWGTGGNFVWPVYPILLVDRFHATYTQVGILATITSLVSLASYVVWGRQSDLRPTVKLYALALAGPGLVPLIYLFSPSVEWLVLASLCQGIASAGIEVAGFNAFSRIPPEGALVRYQVAVSAAVGIRGPLTTMLGSALYATPWFGAAPLLVLGSLLMLGAGMVAGSIDLKSRPQAPKEQPASP